MDNAGRSIALFIIEYIEDPFNQKFVIIAGPGNNGGDAIICHYFLNYYGVESQLLLLNLDQKDSWIFEKYSIEDESIKYYSKTYKFDLKYWYIDGIFGIGLKRTIRGVYKEIIDKLKNKADF